MLWRADSAPESQALPDVYSPTSGPGELQAGKVSGPLSSLALARARQDSLCDLYTLEGPWDRCARGLGPGGVLPGFDCMLMLARDT